MKLSRLYLTYQFVTETDQAVEDYIRKAISAKYPDHKLCATRAMHSADSLAVSGKSRPKATACRSLLTSTRGLLTRLM
jgi:fructose-1,6-bisphosphatase/inositol monophosphatase family enzyme